MASDATHSGRTWPRWAAFGSVATLGFAVQVGVIILLTGAGVHISAATAAGVFIAILHNFAWHERWTWSDRRPSTTAASRLAQVICANGLVSLAGTVGLTTLWVSVLGATIVAGNLAAVASVGTINYLLLDRQIYRS